MRGVLFAFRQIRPNITQRMSKRIKVNQIEYSIIVPLSEASAVEERSPLVKLQFIGKDGRSKVQSTYDQANLIELLRTLTVMQHEIDSLQSILVLWRLTKRFEDYVRNCYVSETKTSQLLQNKNKFATSRKIREYFEFFEKIVIQSWIMRVLLDDTGDLTNQLVNLFNIMPDDLKTNYDESIRASELVEKAIEYVPFYIKM